MSIRNWTDDDGVVWGQRQRMVTTGGDGWPSLRGPVNEGRPFMVSDPGYVPDWSADPAYRERDRREADLAGYAALATIALIVLLLGYLVGAAVSQAVVG